MIKIYDRIRETTATTGTGTITLAGAVSGFLAFTNVLSNGDWCYYTIISGTSWECGYGQFTTSGTTLARTYVLSNHLGTTANITLAGTSEVFIDSPAAINGKSFLFANGADGAVTFDGSTTILGHAPAANVYTLTRDIYCTNITIDSGVSIIPSGWRIFANGILVNNGTIQWKGNNASGTTKGAGLTRATYGTVGGRPTGGGDVALEGANGRTTAGAGVNGNIEDVMAGKGGTGGSDGGANAGGSMGSPTRQSNSYAYDAFRWHSRVVLNNSTSVRGLSGGGGGAAGGCSGVGASGAGGGGGGIVVIYAAHIVNNGTISANGGNGSAAGGAVAAGGGGGGGGGEVFVCYITYTGSDPTATGGALGAGANGGNNGVAGSDGYVIKVPV